MRRVIPPFLVYRESVGRGRGVGEDPTTGRHTEPGPISGKGWFPMKGSTSLWSKIGRVMGDIRNGFIPKM